MELTINRSMFLEELTKASKIIDPRNINPSLAGILIETGVDNLTIISTNGSLSYKSVLTTINSDLEIKNLGKILIKSKYILDMLRKIEDDFITLATIENNELRITTSKVEFNINILNSEDYPLIGFRERGVIIELNAKDLKQAINQTVISINEWNKKIALTGANLKTKNSQLIVSTTDMHRISQKTIKLANEVTENINIIIPYKVIIDLPKFIESAKVIKVVISEGYATFVIDKNLLQTNLIDGQFPAVEQAFPAEFNNIMTVDSRKLLKTLNRADLPSEDGLASTVNLKINQGSLIVRTNVVEIGNFEEEFQDFKLEGQGNMIIAFNSKFLQDAIKSFDGEEIELKFVNSTRAVVINKTSDQNLKQVVLPTYIGE